MFPPAEEHPRWAATLSCRVDPQEELASGTGTVLMDESFATGAQETNEGAQKRNWLKESNRAILKSFVVVVVENSGYAISLHFGELVAPKIS